MLHLLIAAILFLGSCTAASADAQKGFATVKDDETVAWQTARFTPVAGPRTTADSKHVAENYAAVLGNLRSLAGQGDPEAQYKLGLMYFRGEGVAQNYVVAFMWLQLANAGATGGLGAATVKTRFEISTFMTPDQIADARRLAIAWQEKRTPGMPTPTKKELINSFAKVDACGDAGHLARTAIEKVIVPRVQYYARLFFTERDIDEMGANIPIKKKNVVTALGWGCESAFDKLAALPLPKAPGSGAH